MSSSVVAIVLVYGHCISSQFVLYSSSFLSFCNHIPPNWPGTLQLDTQNVACLEHLYFSNVLFSDDHLVILQFVTFHDLGKFGNSPSFDPSVPEMMVKAMHSLFHLFWKAIMEHAARICRLRWPNLLVARSNHDRRQGR